MKKFIILSIIAVFLSMPFVADYTEARKIKQRPKILKVLYDGECASVSFTAFGTHSDRWKVAISGRYKATAKTKGFGASGTWRLPRGMTRDGITGEMCRVPNYRDFRNVQINAVLMKNGTIVDRKCAFQGGPAWMGCR